LGAREHEKRDIGTRAVRSTDGGAFRKGVDHEALGAAKNRSYKIV
jgi:hypothetical protein